MSRYGWMSLSLMACQMMRVISSPSSSTTVPSTLIFDTVCFLLISRMCRARHPPYRAASDGPIHKLALSHASVETGRPVGVEYRGGEQPHPQTGSGGVHFSRHLLRGVLCRQSGNGVAASGTAGLPCRGVHPRKL